MRNNIYSGQLLFVVSFMFLHFSFAGMWDGLVRRHVYLYNITRTPLTDFTGIPAVFWGVGSLVVFVPVVAINMIGLLLIWQGCHISVSCFSGALLTAPFINFAFFFLTVVPVTLFILWLRRRIPSQKPPPPRTRQRTSVHR